MEIPQTLQIKIDFFHPVNSGDCRAVVGVTIEDIFTIRGIVVLEPLGQQPRAEMPSYYMTVEGLPYTNPYVIFKDKTLEQAIQQLVLDQYIAWKGN